MIRVGGVPENVNVPWYLAIESGGFDEEVTWRDCPGGTGEMTRLLADREIDVALALTEGTIAHISKGGDARIVGTYVNSPLIWGVHVGSSSAHVGPNDLRGGRFAVSRIGSGSHLMSTVYATQNEWGKTDAPTFVIVGGLDGALQAFDAGEVDGFLWEKYMTKPLVDDGTLRRIDECRAPWPAFSIAATPEFFSQRERVTSLIKEARRFVDVVERDPSRFADEIESRYGLERVDIEAWLGETKISCSTEVPKGKLLDAISFMDRVGLLENSVSPQDVVVQEIVRWI